MDGLSEWVVRSPEEVQATPKHTNACEKEMERTRLTWVLISRGWPVQVGPDQVDRALPWINKLASSTDTLLLTFQVYGLMERGQEQRATGATKKNEMSSRSHAVFIIIVEQSVLAARSDDGGVAAAAAQIAELRASMANPGADLALSTLAALRQWWRPPAAAHIAELRAYIANPAGSSLSTYLT